LLVSLVAGVVIPAGGRTELIKSLDDKRELKGPGREKYKTAMVTRPHTIDVSVRVRPAPPSAAGDKTIQISPNGGVRVGGGDTFAFASSVVEGSDQAVAHANLAANLLVRLDQGYSCTLVAYGQTGSGKTHTMFGPAGSLTEASLSTCGAGGQLPKDWGILPRAIMTIIDKANAASSNGEVSTTVHASAVEVYQELAYDLLNNKAPLQVGMKGANQRQGMGGDVSGGLGKSAVNGTHPAGCRCQECVKVKEAEREMRRIVSCVRRGDTQNLFQGSGVDPIKMKKLIAQAEDFVKSEKNSQKRKPSQDDGFQTVGETLMPLKDGRDVMQLARTVELSRSAVAHALNERSSRSHCLVQVHVTARRGSVVTKQQLYIVDLAGSERILKSQVEGVARSQAIAINSSLTVLGRCIAALGQPGTTSGYGGDVKPAHVPYRDSTLTMLLRSSFGGRSFTSVVICVASERAHVEESRCSLQFGQRLARVKSNAAVAAGENVDGQADVVQAALATRRAELVALAAQGKGPGHGFNADPAQVKAFQRSVARLDELEREIMARRVAAKERGAGGGVNELNAEAATLRANIANSKTAVDRLTKVPFWREASPAYSSKQREIAELEASLVLLGTQPFLGGVTVIAHEPLAM
jgi:hypothetical protein